jgi:hypothetical protein
VAESGLMANGTGWNSCIRTIMRVATQQHPSGVLRQTAGSEPGIATRKVDKGVELSRLQRMK